jgi:glycine dehydrogenase
MNTQQFVNRHINLNDADKDAMLSKIGVSSIDELISQTIPDSIRLAKDLDIPEHFRSTKCFSVLRNWQRKI